MAGARLRGTGAGLLLDLQSASSFDEVLAMARATIAERSGFLEGAALSLDCGEVSLSGQQVVALVQLFRDAGVEVQSIVAGAGEVYSDSETAVVRRRQEEGGRHREGGNAPEARSLEVLEGECGLVVGTVRSGQSVWHPGTIIIFGDVNPGAEIVAGGSVVVWGTLRGTVHAGAGGDQAAAVCALDLSPTQLRIGNCIARSPDGPATPKGAEMARAQDGVIVVESWVGRRSRPATMGTGALPRAVQGTVGKLLKGVRRWGA